MDDSGVEGLEDQEIMQIPIVKISLEQLKERPLQCSVCLEYLQANEEAKKLPCNHYFHESCIVPWLELRGTCPDCRMNLAVQSILDETEVFETDEDEETLSGYESAHSNRIQSHVWVVNDDPYTRESFVRVVESVNGNVYYEEIEDDPTQYSFRNLNDYYSDPFSHHLIDMTRSPITSPITVTSEDEDFRYSISPKRRWGDSSPSP